MANLRDITGKLALLCLGFFVAAIAAESVLRWLLTDLYVYQNPRFEIESVYPADRGPTMREPLLGAGLRYTDKPWHFGLKRDLRARLVSSEFDVAIRTNSEGLRGPEISSPKTRPRILGLGDSFAMGFGVEEDETYLSAIAGHWPSGPAEAINAGVVGYSPGNSFEFLMSAGLKLKPDLVLFQLWVVDDLCDGRSISRPIPVEALPPQRVWRERARQSHLAMFVRDRLRSVDYARDWFLRKGMAAPFPVVPLLDRRFELRCKGLVELVGMLSEADRATRVAGGRLIVLLLPASEQVYVGDWQRAVDYNLVRLDSTFVDLEAPNRFFTDTARREGLEVIDALGWLREHQVPDRLYFTGYDPHLTAAGHKVVGDLVYEHLFSTPIDGSDSSSVFEHSPARVF